MAVQLTDINTLKKEDIIFYLNHFVMLITTATANMDIDFRTINNYLIKDKYGPQFINETIYYNTMRVFEFMLYKQLYSYKYDSIFTDLKEDTINNLTFPKDLFVNPSDEKRFSKKQVIKYIRNAINHNDSNRELYHIVQTNEKLILDIHLLNTKPIPFHVQIDMQKFIDIEKQLISSDANPDLTVLVCNPSINYLNPNFIQELNKVIIRRYNFKDNNKNNKEIAINIVENGQADINNLPKLGTSNEDYTDYQLSMSQKTKITQDIKIFIHNCHIIPNSKLLTYLLNNITQFGSTKIYGLTIDMFFCDHYLGRNKKSLQDFQNDVIAYAYNPSNSYLKKYIKDISNFDFMFYRAWDFDQLVLDSYNVLVSYIFDSYIKDEFVNIGGKQIEKQKIRDSFVHGRYYIGNHNKYKLFDSYNGRNNESKINWQETIHSKDLTQFINTIVNPIVTNYHINIPIRFFPKPVKHFSVTIDNNRFVVALDEYSDIINQTKYDILKFNKDDISFANEEEINNFIQQIKYLPDETKNNYKDKIDEIIEYNKDKLKEKIISKK